MNYCKKMINYGVRKIEIGGGISVGLKFCVQNTKQIIQQELLTNILSNQRVRSTFFLSKIKKGLDLEEMTDEFVPRYRSEMRKSRASRSVKA